ncbi:MAG: Rieske 2Fe-2S domain-containing protein [Alphaproteobacteria bacterium]
MLSKEQNQRITENARDTPAGDLLRRYWQPAALVDELVGDRPAVPVELLGEQLVLFRDEQGDYGLVGRQCPHRGADLKFGRLEDGGIRCPFHGWLFDKYGKCLDQPAEPVNSNFHTKISHTAYPCVERSGIVFAYLGPGDPPPVPAFDCFVAPENFTFAFKGYIDANWLQALEVGIDPAHASFLHRFFEDKNLEDGYGQQFRDSTEDIPVTKLLREAVRPDIDVEETDFGMRIKTLRDLGNAGMHVRVTNLAFPNAIVIPMSNDMTISQWHVPINDRECYWYAIFTDFEHEVDRQAMRDQRLELYSQPDYKPLRNRSNDWGYDPEEQRTQTYTGMGMDINVHDNWAVESPGAIFDRSTEHLGTTDKAIIAYRKMLMAAIDKVEVGKDAPKLGAALTGPIAVDTIGPVEDWQNSWIECDTARRCRSPWAKEI